MLNRITGKLVKSAVLACLWMGSIGFRVGGGGLGEVFQRYQAWGDVSAMGVGKLALGSKTNTEFQYPKSALCSFGGSVLYFLLLHTRLTRIKACLWIRGPTWFALLKPG